MWLDGVIDIVIGEVKSRGQQLQFNQALRSSPRELSSVLRWVGLFEEGLFETLRDKNFNSFARAHFDAIITTDTHSFHVLTHECPAANGARPVLHHTQILGDPNLDGALPLRHRRRMTVTYHDPCCLGRYNAIFCAPAA